MDYYPDKWLIIKIKNDKPLYKVLGSWFGGYIGANSWRVNSGIKKVEKDGDILMFHGSSGSVYHCHKENYGSHMLARSIISNKDYIEELDNCDWTKFQFN